MTVVEMKWFGNTPLGGVVKWYIVLCTGDYSTVFHTGADISHQRLKEFVGLGVFFPDTVLAWRRRLVVKSTFHLTVTLLVLI